MIAPKGLLDQVPKREFRRELKYLRARREALNQLIHSLECYVRFQPKGRGKNKKAA